MISFKKIFFSLIIFLLANLLPSFAQDNSLQLGFVIFTAENSCELMIYSNNDNPSIIISKNSILSVKNGKDFVKVLVTDICGRYIRAKCIAKESNFKLSALEGSPVLFFDSDNKELKYSDARRLLAFLIKSYENFIFSVESTEDATLIAGYVGTFASELENLLPEMDRLNKKYPELKNFYTSPPVELEYEAQALKALEPSLSNAFFKVRLFSASPEVEKSMERLGKVIERLKNAGK